MALTDVAIRKAKSADKPSRMFDGGGLYLEIAPSGGKLWRLKYRFGGKEKRLAIGTYPEISLLDARNRREAARKLLANGSDPADVKKAQKAARIDREANTGNASIVPAPFPTYRPTAQRPPGPARSGDGSTSGTGWVPGRNCAAGSMVAAKCCQGL